MNENENEYRAAVARQTEALRREAANRADWNRIFGDKNVIHGSALSEARDHLALAEIAYTEAREESYRALTGYRRVIGSGFDPGSRAVALDIARAVEESAALDHAVAERKVVMLEATPNENWIGLPISGY